MDDPKRRTKPLDDQDETAGEDVQTQLAALQATVASLIAQKTGGISEDRLEAILSRVAQMSADAQERAANPSNKTHPAISVYSYPEGDRARPRPPLKCPMSWVGYDITHDTTTAEEIELFNQAEPGEYMFRRTTNEPEKLTVTGERDAFGKLSKLRFSFLTKEQKETLPSTATMLRQAFNIPTAEELELQQLRAEVARLKEAVPA